MASFQSNFTIFFFLPNPLDFQFSMKSSLFWKWINLNDWQTKNFYYYVLKVIKMHHAYNTHLIDNCYLWYTIHTHTLYTPFNKDHPMFQFDFILYWWHAFKSIKSVFDQLKINGKSMCCEQTRRFHSKFYFKKVLNDLSLIALKFYKKKI